jgi:hypothetical protein
MPLPGDLNVITVTGYYEDPETAAPLTGQVIFVLQQPVTDPVGHVTLAAGQYEAPLENGAFSITLPCTDNATNPTNFAYQVVEQIEGVNRSNLFQLPHSLGATVDISTLVPVNPPTPYSPVYAVVAQSNTYTGALNDFTASEVRVATPVNSADATTKAYVDAHTAPVTSVNGATGAVVITPGGIGAVATSAVGAASGVASLDSGGHMPAGQLPASALTTSTNAAGDVTGTFGALVLAATANVLAIIHAQRLDQMAAPAANVSFASNKITGLANGSTSSDAAAFGQIPTPGAVTAQTTFGLSSANGSSASFAHTDHTHGTPSLLDRHARMLGLVGETFPAECINHLDLGLSAGFLIVGLVRPGLGPITNLGTFLGAHGVTPSGVNAFALFDEAGNQLAITGDLSSALSDPANDNSYVEFPVGSPYTNSTEGAAFYVGALCHMSGSDPKIGGIFSGSGLQLPSVKGHRMQLTVSGQTTMPASFSVAGAAAASAAYYFTAS